MNTPSNYTNQLFSVYIEVADKAACLEGIKSSEFAFALKDKTIEEFGFTLAIPNQLIPEIIRLLIVQNHAIYQVIRKKVT